MAQNTRQDKTPSNSTRFLISSRHQRVQYTFVYTIFLTRPTSLSLFTYFQKKNVYYTGTVLLTRPTSLILYLEDICIYYWDCPPYLTNILTSTLEDIVMYCQDRRPYETHILNSLFRNHLYVLLGLSSLQDPYS